MHSSLAPNMEASLESKFSAAFEQQNVTSGSNAKSQLLNGGSHKRSSNTVPTTTTATPSTESSGEKTVSFRKGNDLESFEALSSLFANGLFTDLVICCSGKMFKCHRVVMAAASLYIRDALSAFYNNAVDGNSGCNHCNTVMILPKEIKMNDMEAILRFIYDGHVEVKVDSIESFLKSARMLNIKGLSNVNIVFNNNGSSATDESVDDSIDEHPSRKNNGYTKNAHNQLLNGHTGMNSPPPSPPSLNSSLASLKALAANQSSSPSPLANGHHHHHHNAKHLNGLGQYRHSSLKRDQSPLRNDQSSSLLSHNITPAHQSSTPKSIFANGSLFNNNVRLDAANSIVPSSGGSRRKQKFPTNIPPTFLSDIPPLAAALYNTWLNSEEDDDEVDDGYVEKKLIIKDESSNDCSTTGDMSNASMEVAAKHPALGPFGALPLGSFNPQMPCMIEVEADPTNFPTYCHDQNENATLLQTANKRRRHFKSGFPVENMFNNKKLKLPYGANINSPNGDISIKPFSPLMTNPNQQPSPVDLLTKKHGGMRPSMPDEKPLFSAYSSSMKTAAGSNPAASPSSASSVPGSGSWAGNKWKCDICNKYYGNKQTLKEHMDYFHSNREEQIYICNICNKEYTWRKSLMKHYRDIHQMRNTPALAEINRQLAALATTKARSLGNPSPSLASPLSNDSSTLQSYVSIANNMNRKPNSKDDGSKSDFDGDDNEIVDAVPEEEDEEDSNEEVEIEGSNSPNADSREESASVNAPFEGEKEENSSPIEKQPPTTNGTATNDLSDTSSNAVAENSPSSSPPSS